MIKEEKSVFKILNEINDDVVFDKNAVFEKKKEIKEELLNEESLSRILIHLDNGRPFAIISACRSCPQKEPTQEDIERQNELNEENTEKLERLIRGAGFGYNRVNGVFVETHPDEYGEHRTEVKETSFIVFAGGEYKKKRWGEDKEEDKEWEERLYKFCIQAGKDFKQESVLFFDSNKKGVHLYTGGKKDDKPYIFYGDDNERIIYADDERSKYEFTNISRVDDGVNYTELPKDHNRRFQANQKLKREVDSKQNRKDFFTKYFKDKKYESVLIEETSRIASKIYREHGMNAVAGYSLYLQKCDECWDSKTRTFDWERLKELTRSN